MVYPIDPKQLTQKFGDNPAAYARFGLKGHNGWDFKTIWPDTPGGRRYILACFNSKFYKKGNEGTDGFGLYFETTIQLKSLWKLTHAHCHSIEDFQTKNTGDHMAISDNTGNSSGPHLHLTTKRGEMVNGVFNSFDYNNGFFGAVDPQLFFDELEQFINSSNNQTMDPMIQKKASGFDRVWNPFKYNGKSPEQSEEKDHLEFVAWIKDNVLRAGFLDKVRDIVKPGMSLTKKNEKNEVVMTVTADEFVEMIRKSGNLIDEAAIRKDERVKFADQICESVEKQANE